MTGTLSTLDISNLGSSDERIAARRTRAEAKLKQDKERGCGFFCCYCWMEIDLEKCDKIDICACQFSSDLPDFITLDHLELSD